MGFFCVDYLNSLLAFFFPGDSCGFSVYFSFLCCCFFVVFVVFIVVVLIVCLFLFVFVFVL